MILPSINQFAEAESSASGIGAFNINLKSFLFQLLTFLLVMLVFKRWVLPPISKTLEERRNTVEKSLTQAREIEEKLAKAEQRATDILHKARAEADTSLATAKTQAKTIIADAEVAAQDQSARLLAENQQQLQLAKEKLHEELRSELGELVVSATEKVLRSKLSAQADMELIKRSLKEIE